MLCIFTFLVVLGDMPRGWLGFYDNNKLHENKLDLIYGNEIFMLFEWDLFVTHICICFLCCKILKLSITF